MPSQEQYIKVGSEKVAGDIFELKIDGFLDFSSSEQVEQALEGIFSQGVYKIIVNLAQTKYISSAGFGCFISSIDTAMKHNGDIIFTGTPAEIKEIFDILGLSKILRFTDRRDEAVKLLAELKPA
jgi:anti-sigma B factor antagonist